MEQLNSQESRRKRKLPPHTTQAETRQISARKNNAERKYAAEQGIAEEEALKKGMEEKSKEFAEKGNEIYAKA